MEPRRTSFNLFLLGTLLVAAKECACQRLNSVESNGVFFSGHPQQPSGINTITANQDPFSNTPSRGGFFNKKFTTANPFKVGKGSTPFDFRFNSAKPDNRLSTVSTTPSFSATRPTSAPGKTGLTINRRTFFTKTTPTTPVNTSPTGKLDQRTTTTFGTRLRTTTPTTPSFRTTKQSTVPTTRAATRTTIVGQGTTTTLKTIRPTTTPPTTPSFKETRQSTTPTTRAATRTTTAVQRPTTTFRTTRPPTPFTASTTARNTPNHILVPSTFRAVQPFSFAFPIQKSTTTLRTTGPTTVFAVSTTAGDPTLAARRAEATVRTAKPSTTTGKTTTKETAPALKFAPTASTIRPTFISSSPTNRRFVTTATQQLVSTVQTTTRPTTGSVIDTTSRLTLLPVTARTVKAFSFQTPTTFRFPAGFTTVRPTTRTRTPRPTTSFTTPQSTLRFAFCDTGRCERSCRKQFGPAFNASQCLNNACKCQVLEGCESETCAASCRDTSVDVESSGCVQGECKCVVKERCSTALCTSLCRERMPGVKEFTASCLGGDCQCTAKSDCTPTLCAETCRKDHLGEEVINATCQGGACQCSIKRPCNPSECKKTCRETHGNKLVGSECASSDFCKCLHN